ncbi:MAG: hypothetical protein EOP51_05210 [Sphingobacteriales bacterium]|nr:MAG: hypothetical protein EOP51_05210 [Sphingobacteriales bacterium]
MLTSCYSANKAKRQVWKAQAYHPEVVAGICNDIYPAHIDSSFTSEIFLKGDTLVLIDTLLSIDTTTALKYIFRTVKSTDTIVRSKSVQVYNKAEKVIMENKLATVYTELVQSKEMLKVWRLIAIICGVLICICLLIRVLR